MLHCIHYIDTNVNSDDVIKQNAEQIKLEYHNHAVSPPQGGTENVPLISTSSGVE